jgi:purine-binding chemotaxis protein CheW
MELKTELNEIQTIIFALGNEEFAIDISRIQSIIKIPEITKIPNSPNTIRGMIDLRGQIIVIVDLRLKFGFQAKEDDNNTTIIIIEVGENTIGIVVDEVKETLTLKKEQIEQAPSIITQKIHADYINGVGVLDKRLIIILDILKVLGIDEITEIEKLQNVSQEIKKEIIPNKEKISEINEKKDTKENTKKRNKSKRRKHKKNK